MQEQLKSSLKTHKNTIGWCKVQLKPCLRHCCPQRSCCLLLTHTWSAVWDDDSRTDYWWPQLFCARTHAPKRALHPRELSASEACKRGQAERRAQNLAPRQSDSIATETSKCFFRSLEPAPASRHEKKADSASLSSSRSYSDVWLAACSRH